MNDSSVEPEMLFVDDLVEEMFDALEGKEHHCEFDGVETVPDPDGRFCCAPVTHKATLGRIVQLLHEFHDQPKTLVMPEIAPGSFEKKLYSMYLSYLPKEKVAFDLKMNSDDRGSFTELLKTEKCGQFSVNISKPGITKGQYWHNSKWEFFVVVSGHGLIRERKIGTDPATGSHMNRLSSKCLGRGYRRYICCRGIRIMPTTYKQFYINAEMFLRSMGMAVLIKNGVRGVEKKMTEEEAAFINELADV